MSDKNSSTAISSCYCGSGKEFIECCEPYIKGLSKAPTAEALMCSRYSAYATHATEYLWATTAPSERKHYSRAALLEWAKSNHWMKLEIIKSTTDTIEFNAYYLDTALIAQVHHEKSRFILINGEWFYLDGEY